MSEVLELLILLLLVVTIIIIVIEINALVKKQANLVLEVRKKEGYIMPSTAYNDAAILSTVPNYLRTSSQNAKDVKNSPALIPYHNGSRGEMAFNYAVPTKNAMHLKNANSKTGLRNEVSFPGQINATSCIQADNMKEAPGKIAIPGASIKADRVVYDDNAPIIQAKSDITLDEMDSNFSTNSRMNASAARAMMPNESTAAAVVEGMHTGRWKRIGKL